MALRAGGRMAGVVATGLLIAVRAFALDQPAPALPPVLADIDRVVRERFYDPGLKGVDWSAAVSRATDELTRASTPTQRDAVYDRLIAVLDDSHTFRIAPGTLPERNWGTVGVRIGRDGDGFAVKGVLPGSAAERIGMKIGDRILSVGGRAYGREKVNFRDLFFVFEGAPGSAVEVTWQPAGGVPRTDRLTRQPEEAGDALVWKSARVIRRGDKAYGYVHLWGMSAETALAIVDLLLDRAETARHRPELAGWGDIEGLLLDVRGNSGGYDPNILPTFLRGQWSAEDFYVISREGKRLVPPAYRPLPVALLVNSGTASAGETLALKVRAHRIGAIVGEATAGMATRGAGAYPLSDGSSLWITGAAVEALDGKSYEGQGVPPDVAVADRPAAAAGAEDAITEAGLKLLGISRQ